MARKMSVENAIERAAMLSDRERFCLDAWHFNGRLEAMKYMCWECSREVTDDVLVRPEADRLAKCAKWFASNPVKGYLQELERADQERVAQLGLESLDLENIEVKDYGTLLREVEYKRTEAFQRSDNDAYLKWTDLAVKIKTKMKEDMSDEEHIHAYVAMRCTVDCPIYREKAALLGVEVVDKMIPNK